MSEGRAITNFSGNAIATLIIGTWTKQVDHDRVRRVLSGELPFDEASLGVDDHAPIEAEADTDAETRAELEPATR
jgi:aerobic C4-dicarboxylate transport protein